QGGPGSGDGAVHRAVAAGRGAQHRLERAHRTPPRTRCARSGHRPGAARSQGACGGLRWRAGREKAARRRFPRAGPHPFGPGMSSTEPRVLIVDDQALVRTGFRMILTARGIAVAGEAGDGDEAIAVFRRLRPDVVLMDIRMPRTDGLEAAGRILELDPRCRVIMLTTFDLDRYVYAALAIGASGFLLKDVTPEHLAAAVRLVATGDALLAPSITRRLVE